MTKMNEHDLNEIVAAVIKRLKGEFDLQPKAKQQEPEAPPAKTILGFDSLGLPRVIRPGESRRDEPSELDAMIEKIAAEHEAHFRPSENDRQIYRCCTLCSREFFSLERYNNHKCVVMGKVAPYYQPDPLQPMRAATAADRQYEIRKAVVAEAMELLNNQQKEKSDD